jgi:small GTP-binding protein
MSDEYDFLFKSIVVGDGGVGKTALTLRFSKDFFSEDYKMTIGVDFHVKTLTIDTNEGPIRSKLQIWDTGGQERFSSIRPMYYRGSLGALLIFDLTNYESFEHLPQWIEEVRANVKNDIPLLLLGNKSDLIDQRSVSNEEINDFTGKFNLYYMETSAKTGDGVGDCFHILACLMIGSGVPDTFLDSGVAFLPGQFQAGAAPSVAISEPSIPEAAPSFEPEPADEFEFAAPPVPEKSIVLEPEDEFEFAAPPVPEKSLVAESQPSFTIEPEPEIEFESPSIPVPTPAPENVEFEFKPPDEIISGAIKENPPLEISKAPTFSPKAVPFSSNIPVPAPAPEGFPGAERIPSPETKIETPAPFFTGKPEETTQSKAQPFSVPFDADTKPISVKRDVKFPTPSTEASSDSLLDYMPETIISKKEQKKLDKQRQKEEREKAKRDAIEAKEKAKQDAIDAKEKAKQDAIDAKEKAKQDAIDAKVKAKQDAIDAKEKAKQDAIDAKEKAKHDKEKKIQEAKDKQLEEARLAKEAKAKKKEKPKKEKPVKEKKPKKEKPEPISPTPTQEVPSSLFQSLSQKTEADDSKPSAFVPFMAAEKTQAEETSTLRIIPNVADIDSGSFSPLPSAPTGKESRPSKKEKRREIRICQQCGAMLSSDYAFCNKCGSQL